jgi:hypothetical protein
MTKRARARGSLKPRLALLRRKSTSSHLRLKEDFVLHAHSHPRNIDLCEIAFRFSYRGNRASEIKVSG